jgi:hypothetical protein
VASSPSMRVGTIDLASRMAHTRPFAWFLHPLDVNNPPLFSVIVSWLYRVGAPQIAGARLVSVVAGVTTIVVAFLLGRLLYGERTGLIAAVFLAVTPGAVLVDHNIQVDPLFVSLLVGAVYLYVLATRHVREDWTAVAGGAVLGLAFLAKQPAIIALPVLALWETWREPGVAWLRSRRTWRFLAGFAVLGLPWYAAQWFSKGLTTMIGNAGRIATAAVPLSDVPLMLIVEVAWMMFPLTAILATAGIVYVAIRRLDGDKLVLLMVAGFVAWFVAFHFHPYYLLPLAPVLCLAAARLVEAVLERIPLASVGAASVVVLVALMGFASVLMLGGAKWGRWSPMAYSPSPDPGYATLRLLYDPSMEGVFGPTMRLMPSQLGAASGGPRELVAMSPPEDTEVLLLNGSYQAPDGLYAQPVRVIDETWIRPVLFGYAIGQTVLDTGNGKRFTTAQYFQNSSWRAERIAPWWAFGFASTPVKSGFYLYDKGSFPALNQ